MKRLASGVGFQLELASAVLAVARTAYAECVFDELFFRWGDVLLVKMCTHKQLKVESLVHFLSSLQVNTKDEFGITALHLAVDSQRADVVVELVKGGADVNATDECGHTPLQTAVSQGNLGLVVTLHIAGARMEEDPNYYQATLFTYVPRASESILRYIISRCSIDYLCKIKISEKILLMEVFRYYLGILERRTSVSRSFLFEARVITYIKSFIGI